VTPGGYPASVYALRVRVSTGGAPGAGAIEVSLDGGTSYSAPATVPPSGVVQVPSTSNAIASGLTLTIAGTLALGDLYACDVASNVELNLDAASDWLDGYLARPADALHHESDCKGLPVPREEVRQARQDVPTPQHWR
jgi:hypothetical protein